MSPTPFLRAALLRCDIVHVRDRTKRDGANRQNGHTLFELLVVLAIIGFVAAIAAPMINRPNGSFAAKSAASTIADGLALARSRALDRGEPQIFEIDVESLLYRDGQDADWRPIGKQVTMHFVSAAPVYGDKAAILFYPDGSSSGGEINIAARGRNFRIRTGLNGRVSVEKEDAEKRE